MTHLIAAIIFILTLKSTYTVSVVIKKESCSGRCLKYVYQYFIWNLQYKLFFFPQLLVVVVLQLQIAIKFLFSMIFYLKSSNFKNRQWKCSSNKPHKLPSITGRCSNIQVVRGTNLKQRHYREKKSTLLQQLLCFWKLDNLKMNNL